MSSKNTYMANGFDPSTLDSLDPEMRAMVERRSRVLAPSYRLFYREPVEFVRGSGVRLFDSHGRSYLDVYNNVPAVGHANPRVTQAVCEQMSRLNTHTRYVTLPIIEYSERLIGLFPEEIGQVIYACTGSEAVDLALRIAKYETGRGGVIVTRHAYHGTTTEAATISPSLGPHRPTAGWVRYVDAPDTSVEGADAGRLFADRVRQTIDGLESDGTGFAAFIADSIFSSDGLQADPAGFLKPVVDVVHAAGGLYLADEVQPGFGRTGDAWWGFLRHGILPDLVILGKPMGNGMPISAVVGRPEVLERFGNDMRYFNTFGGNSVCIAAANAVLDVIEDGNLLENIRRLGGLLGTGLRGIARDYPMLSEVRGCGLFYGVDVVTGPGSQAADKDGAERIVNALRQRRVLISSSGREDNVLKIRPPLVFSDADLEEFLGSLRSVMEDLHG
ncbi:aspartate aminotransferase family protein [Arthrobacter sp. GCM10027362]|uniref:aspartate aminotransferase family protein n=1 Tax=Arthrobacter sp. GCM10027362 TaxID=3273379 RepID=UPI003628773E